MVLLSGWFIYYCFTVGSHQNKTFLVNNKFELDNNQIKSYSLDYKTGSKFDRINHVFTKLLVKTVPIK